METSVITPFDQLRQKYSAEWPAIVRAREHTNQKFRELKPINDFGSDNTAVVVFGSFARRELTPGSDADWSLLIDGPSDPQHFQIVHKVQQCLEGLGFQKPGTTATFGTLVSSHELIHNIGGVRDTNQNLTRRILLLLESLAITNPIVQERVLRGILSRYIVSDLSVSWYSQPSLVVPRFLLNDIVRFWRTMAVDYAAKQWEQSNQKWALRNAKLRMSRKLLFVGGLLICFSFELHPPEDRSSITLDRSTKAPSLADFLFGQMRFTPIDLVSRELLRGDRPDTVKSLMNSYDGFMALLEDDESRRHLEDLKFEDVADDVVFRRVRELSHSFQEGLTELFFGDEDLRQLVTKYGVF
jgi:hypothetical protein